MYTGGLRIVDLSGDLLGDLYKQGREIGYLLTGNPKGYIPNDTMVWGAQLYKGHVFYSDFNSGLGAAKVLDDKPDNSKTNQYVETIFKRKINIKGIADKNFAVRGFAERQAINAPIQGLSLIHI